MRYCSPEFPAEDSVDEGVDCGVDVADPEDDVVEERGSVQLQKTRQRHPGFNLTRNIL